jgi:20S proteasome alpha/beta subunit
MSLVIAYNAMEYQVWCCDGRTVVSNAGSFIASGEGTIKIGRLKTGSILCGWVGEKYDADSMISSISAARYITVAGLLQKAAICCEGINGLSSDFCHRNDRHYCPTGLILGGFNFGRRFLATITPEGEIIRRERYAAIGIGTDIVAGNMSEARQHPLPVARALPMMKDCMTEVMKEHQFVGGAFAWFVVSPDRTIELQRCETSPRTSPTC